MDLQRHGTASLPAARDLRHVISRVRRPLTKPAGYKTVRRPSSESGRYRSDPFRTSG